MDMNVKDEGDWKQEIAQLEDVLKNWDLAKAQALNNNLLTKEYRISFGYSHNTPIFTRLWGRLQERLEGQGVESIKYQLRFELKITDHQGNAVKTSTLKDTELVGVVGADSKAEAEAMLLNMSKFAEVVTLLSRKTGFRAAFKELVRVWSCND